jgi:hypothetical protein
MTCKDCGHAVSMNKMCETPLQSATNILKHMATHTASYAFTSVGRVTRPELEIVPIIELAHALGVPARVDRSDSPIAQLSPMPPECGLSGFSSDQLRLGEALLTTERVAGGFWRPSTDPQSDLKHSFNLP